MSDWTFKKLGELLKEKNKSSLQVQDATNYGEYPFFTSGEAILLHNNYIVDGENLFLATGGKANIKYYAGKAAYSTDTYTIYSDNSDNKFLYYLILFNIDYIDTNLFSGSGLKHLQKKDLKNLFVYVPKHKSKQSLIVEILSSADEAIEQTKKLIAKYQRIKTGLMQDLLTCGIDEHGNIRRKATHKFGVKKGIEVPEEWEVEAIGDVCNVTKLAGYEFTKYFDYSVGGEIIALRALNIKNEKIILDDIQTIPKKVSEMLPRSKIYKNDVLITYIGAYIGDILLIKESDKYHLAPNIAKITAGKKLLPEFLEIVLKSYHTQKQIKNLTAVTATPSLTMGQIRNIIISFPKDPKEQERVIVRINSIRQCIKDEQNKLAKLHSIKTGLMQDLLSGRVRVKVNEN